MVAASSAPATSPGSGAEQRPAPQAQAAGGQHRAEQGGDAVGPDRAGLRLGDQRHAGRLQPVCRTGFFERRVLEVDVDEVAALQHLRGGLGEAGFVAVGRRQGDEARQAGEQRDQRGEQAPAPTARQNLQASWLGHRRLDSMKRPAPTVLRLPAN